MPVTPDDKMTVPIDRLVAWAARTVQRVQRWLSMPPEQLEDPMVWAVFEKEDQFVHAYRTALTLRAGEVVRYCDSIGITGCTVAKVRENPFLVVMAIDHILHGGNHEDRQTQDQ
ncbi:MAG: hypothetical protein GC159_20925 [Phycisphaera sp.]|nr:hypothetical protein [Phycisphaera sp.]